MFQAITYNWLKSTVKEWEVIDISLNWYDNPIWEARFFVKIKRADPDEEAIRNGVEYTYQDRMRSVLEDPSDVRKEMKEEIERRIDNAWKTWQSLPKAMIFDVFIRQVQRKSGETKILCGVSLDVARYFIEHKWQISSMLFDFDKIPHFTFQTDKAKFVMEQVNAFHEEYTITDWPENKQQSPQINIEDWKEYQWLTPLAEDVANIAWITMTITNKMKAKKQQPAKPKVKKDWSLEEALKKKF